MSAVEWYQRDGRWFAHFPGLDLSTPEQRHAQTMLLSSASDLLGELQKAAPQLSRSGWEADAKRARLVIAKATGDA
jgi:hypothetical protein